MSQDPGVSEASGCAGALRGDAWATSEPSRCSRGRASRPSASQQRLGALGKPQSRTHCWATQTCPQPPRASGRRGKPFQAAAGLTSLELLLLLCLSVTNTDQAKDLQRFQPMHFGTQCPISYQTAIQFSRTQTAQHSCTAGVDGPYPFLTFSFAPL